MLLYKNTKIIISIMTSAIKLSENFIAQAKRYATINHRSLPKQIEYWSHIGKIAEENPDLSYNFIKDILLSKDESYLGETEPYSFGDT